MKLPRIDDSDAHRASFAVRGELLAAILIGVAFALVQLAKHGVL